MAGAGFDCEPNSKCVIRKCDRYITAPVARGEVSQTV